MKIITIANQKGGVGKTTSAFTRWSILGLDTILSAKGSEMQTDDNNTRRRVMVCNGNFLLTAIKG